MALNYDDLNCTEKEKGGMTAIFTSLGIASHFSVVAVLSYRLVSFWLPILLGFLVTVYLQRTSERKTTSNAPLV